MALSPCRRPSRRRRVGSCRVASRIVTGPRASPAERTGSSTSAVCPRQGRPGRAGVGPFSLVQRRPGGAAGLGDGLAGADDLVVDREHPRQGSADAEDQDPAVGGRVVAVLVPGDGDLRGGEAPDLCRWSGPSRRRFAGRVRDGGRRPSPVAVAYGLGLQPVSSDLSPLGWSWCRPRCPRPPRPGGSARFPGTARGRGSAGRRTTQRGPRRRRRDPRSGGTAPRGSRPGRSRSDQIR